MNHPMLQLIRQVARPGEVERFEIDEEGARIIEHGLLYYSEDSSLSEAVLSVVAMISAFYDHTASPTAAATLATILARTRPKLPELQTGAQEARSMSLERARTVSGRPVDKRAPRFGSKPPRGALKAAAFLDPGRQRRHRPR